MQVWIAALVVYHVREQGYEGDINAYLFFLIFIAESITTYIFLCFKIF